ncbi:hypothetical protein KPH14_007289 [Odynerus spinipes]|uniref:TIL domain-containing protein n=1 Tax=Odynerus spinipes TaxID=1348599 RepID=A0AAD9VIF6_9HYME|nr:hypothetical protein KPH14_007289 [Odynerus spinipes]
MTRITIVLFMLALCSSCIIGASACGPNGVYSDCASACPITCKTRHGGGKFCPTVCRQGCVCINGHILNDQGRCVLPKDC